MNNHYDDEEPGALIIEEEEGIILPTFKPTLLPGFSPMKHQTEALSFMKQREADNTICGGFLSLSMGLGKTFTSLMHVINDTSSNGPTLIVCPKTALYTWVTEIEKFFGTSMSIFIYRKENKKLQTITAEELMNYNVVITNYEYLRTLAKTYNVYNNIACRDIFNRVFCANTPKRPVLNSKKGDALIYSLRWNRIIADESHNFANHKTSLWQSLMCLSSTKKWCLSGTPIRNYGDDMYAQYKFLGYEEYEFNVKDFYKLNLSKYIFYINYDKANIKLPEAKHIRVKCILEEEQARIYDIFLKRANKEFKSFTIGGASFAAIFTLFLRLRQVCIAPYTITPESDKSKSSKITAEYEQSQKVLDDLTQGMATWIRDEEGTAGLQASKIVKATQIIQSIKKGEKIVVFTMFKRVINLLKKKMDTLEGKKKYITIDGSVSGERRDRALDQFKTNPDIEVLFISYKIGAESLNLTEATNIILMEGWWCPAVLEQAKARIHRMGQTKPVTIYELYVPNDNNVKSIEEAIIEICDNKKKIANEYLNGGKSENGGKMDAKTLGEILRIANNGGGKEKKGIRCEDD